MKSVKDAMDAALARIDPRLALALMALVVAFIGWESWVLVLKQPLARYQVVTAAHGNLAAIEGINAGLATQEQELTARLEELEQKVAGASSRLAPDALLVELVARLEALAMQRGVKLNGVKPGASREVPIFEEMSFNVDVRGSYGALFEWLQDIESGLGAVSVKSFRIATGAEPGVLSMALELAAYRRRGAAEARP